MNVHHLELFYFVAKHGGITEAVRNIPYGIQQPAVSGQVAQLEEFLGVTLFQRRPFALTPPGEKLFRFIEPFFSKLDPVAAEIQGGVAHQLRVGASDIVLRDHLPELLRSMRKKFPNLKLALRSGYEPDLAGWLESGEVDMVVTLIGKKSAQGVHSAALIELPLVLLVEKKSRWTSAEQFWKEDKISEPLICLPAQETICKNFQAGLARLGVDWFCALEVSSVDLIETYVANGFGAGLSVAVPKADILPGLRALPLEGFAPVNLGALWRGKLTPLQENFLDEVKSRVRHLAT